MLMKSVYAQLGPLRVRRSRIEMLIDILTCLSHRDLSSRRLRSHAELDYRVYRDLIPWMQHHQLVEIIKEPMGTTYWHRHCITPRGRDSLASWQVFRQLVEEP